MLDGPFMKLEIVTDGEAVEVELEAGVVTVGGGEQDGIRIEGLPEAVAELRIDGERLMVQGRETFTVDDVLSPSGVFRLVLVGERVALSERVWLRQLAAKDGGEQGTAAVLKQLLVEIEEPEETRSAHLTCLTGLDVGRRFPLAGPVADLGRGEEVDIRIRDRAVSRKHARLRFGEQGFSLQDLGSPNGVYVNGKKVRGEVGLEDGAVIELGHSLLRFRAAVEPTVPPIEIEELAPEPEPVPDAALLTVEDKPAEPQPAAARKALRPEVALIGLGALLALAGAVVTFGVLS